MLKKVSLCRINANHSIFITSTGLNGPIVSIFIDNIKIIAIKKSGLIEKVKVKLTSTFQVVNISPISFYLSLMVKQNWEKKTTKLSQLVYIKMILCKFFLDQFNPFNTPMREFMQFLPNDSGKKAINTMWVKHQGIIRLLIF